MKKNIIDSRSVMRKFGLLIQMARKEAGLTQGDLALRLNTSQTQVARWETGKYEPTPSVIRRIADITNKPVAYFFSETYAPSEIDALRKEILLMKEQLAKYGKG